MFLLNQGKKKININLKFPCGSYIALKEAIMALNYSLFIF